VTDFVSNFFYPSAFLLTHESILFAKFTCRHPKQNARAYKISVAERCGMLCDVAYIIM